MDVMMQESRDGQNFQKASMDNMIQEKEYTNTRLWDDEDNPQIEKMNDGSYLRC